MEEDFKPAYSEPGYPEHPSYDPPSAEKLFRLEAPPLKAAWLAHEKANGLVNAPPPPEDHLVPQHTMIKLRQEGYAKACREQNKRMMSESGRDCALLKDVLSETTSFTAIDGFEVPLRFYTPSDINFPQDYVIYYHGGGLCVGDLDSEDLACRRICKEVGIQVVSVGYRLVPVYSPDVALDDAWETFLLIEQRRQMEHLQRVDATMPPGNIFLVGSSSGGQLAAQVSQRARAAGHDIGGLVLRCPVMVDAHHGGKDIPERFRHMHTSFTPSFETSLLRMDRCAFMQKPECLPLNAASFEGLPRTFLQLCTNDIYYSDGACYYEALREAGNDVNVQVWEGWPHTFWLKAPELKESLEADKEISRWLTFLLLARTWELSNVPRSNSAKVNNTNALDIPEVNSVEA